MDPKKLQSMNDQQHLRHPEGEQGQLSQRGGVWFGIVFGLSYALLIWVPHAVLLHESAAAIPKIEIITGTLLCVILWAYVGAKSSRILLRWSLLLSALAGFLTPWVVWFAKSLEDNWIRIIDRGGWELIYRLGEALRSRLFFIGLWGIGIGLFAAVLERLLLPRAWDYTSTSGRVTLRSIGVFLLCLPLTVLLANVSDDMLHKEYHETILGTRENLISLATQEVRRPLITWRYGNKELDVTSSWEWPQGDFDLYLVDYDPDSMGQYFFDAVYTDGSVIRCMAGSSSMQFCGDLEDALLQMMRAIVDGALNRDLSAMRCQECDPYIDPAVAIDLLDIGWKFSADYEISREAHYSGTIAMVAQFESGYRLRCYFSGDQPIVVEKCSGFLEP